VVLENLEIKAEALNSLNLPFAIKKGKKRASCVPLNRDLTISLQGFLGKLRLKVPWKNLKSQAVIVQLDNVFILAQPEYSYAEV
jgi:vacuolar protein sorting-associated protein 13A/C